MSDRSFPIFLIFLSSHLLIFLPSALLNFLTSFVLLAIPFVIPMSYELNAMSFQFSGVRFLF